MRDGSVLPHVRFHKTSYTPTSQLTFSNVHCRQDLLKDKTRPGRLARKQQSFGPGLASNFRPILGGPSFQP